MSVTLSKVSLSEKQRTCLWTIRSPYDVRHGAYRLRDIFFEKGDKKSLLLPKSQLSDLLTILKEKQASISEGTLKGICEFHSTSPLEREGYESRCSGIRGRNQYVKGGMEWQQAIY